MIADIASGETDTADIFFLFAVILMALAGLAYGLRRTDTTPWAPVLGWLGGAFLALGLLVL